MRTRYVGLMIIAVVGVALFLVFVKSRENTSWAFGGPPGTFYKGAGTQTIIGEPTEPEGGEEDQGGYHILVVPDSEKSKPFETRSITGVWELNAASDTTETVSSRVPPMTAKGKAMFALTRPGSGPRAVGRNQNDGDNICDPLGWPRIVYQPIRPVEFFTFPDRQVQHWAWRDQWRTIWTDGRLLPTNPDPLWYGHSVGRWEDDKTFHEVTNGQDERTWLSRYGNVHSLNMVVDAYWRLVDHNTLTLDLTIKDPEIYTEDWVGETGYFHLLTSPEVDPLPCSGSEEVFYMDQMRAHYPEDKDVRATAPKELKVIAPPVSLPNTGVGLSKE